MIHLAWIPKYRKRVLTGKISKRIVELLHECVDMQRWMIKELNVQPDHVHFLVRMRPEISISRMIQLFKGMSSRIIKEEFPVKRIFVGEKFLGRWLLCRNIWAGK